VITRIQKILILIVLLLPLAGFSQEVRASVDANPISQNDVFTFKVEVTDADQFPEVDIAPILRDFSLVSGPGQQTSIQWVNGKMTSSRSLSWTLVPKSSGSKKIPALAVKVGKKSFSTNPINMTIAEGDPVFVSDDLILSAVIDKKNVYIGEQITITYSLFTRVNMSIQNIEFPKHIGFWAEELYVPKQVEFRDSDINGVEYKEATLYRVALFPTKSGEYPLTPMTVNCQVVVQNKNQRRSIWDDPFFSGLTRQTVPKVLKTEEILIKVSSFPEPHPDDFNGAVGDFTIKGLLDEQELIVNEAITYIIEVNGTGNVPLFSLPQIEFPQNLEVFPPSVTIEKTPFRDQITGTIKYEHIIIPRETGRYSIPKVEFSFFDPDAKKYRRATSRNRQLTIIPGDSPIVNTGDLTKEEVALLGQDIRFMRTKTPDFMHTKKSIIPIQAIVLYGFSFVILIFPVLFGGFKSKRNATFSARQSKKAYRIAIRSLNKKSADQFGQVSRAIYKYVHDKFGLSSENLDPIVVQSILINHINNEKLITQLIELLKICDANQFAPGADSAKEPIKSKAKQILKGINASL